MNKRTNTQVQMVADFEGDASVLVTQKESGTYPALCTRNLVLFPSVLAPILIGREKSKALVEKLEEKPDTIFCIFCQKEEDENAPATKDLYPIGIFAKLVKVLDLPTPGDNITIAVQGLGRCKLNSVESMTPYYQVNKPF